MSCEIPADFKEENQLLLDLSDSDNADVYLIRVPKGFDISKLHGNEFSAGEIKEIKAEVGTNQLTSVYELSAFDGEGLDVSPLIKSRETSATLGHPMKGFLSVNKTYRANLTSSHDVSHLVEPAARVPMPEGLRVRFKPFGADIPYKQPSHRAKKKKRKRKLSLDIPDSESTQDILHVRKRQKTHEEADTQKHFNKKHKNKKMKSYFLCTVVIFHNKSKYIILSLISLKLCPQKRYGNTFLSACCKDGDGK